MINYPSRHIFGNIIKKANQNLHALSRVKCYMGSEQNKLIMSSFTKSQISYCPLIWMFCSITSMNKLNNIHGKCLRLVTNDYDSNFNELLESSHELTVLKTCINYLMIVFTLAISWINDWHLYYSEKSLQNTQYPFIWLWKSTVSAFWSRCNSVSC